MKKNAHGKSTSIAQPTVRSVRKELLDSRSKRDGSSALEFLTAGSSSAIEGSGRKLFVHFPEGGMLTLTFQLTRTDTEPSGYTTETYQLTDIEPNPISTYVTSGVNNSN